MEKKYTPKQDYKVLVRCFTYNQAKYIEDALNGFAMQQTNFPFVCHVQDDASTDGEQEVIKQWIERECLLTSSETIDTQLATIIIAKHKINRECTFAFYLLKQNLYKEWERKMDLVKPWCEHCKFEAVCEGDDCWVDETKLQKQVVLLESDPNLSVCFHSYIIEYSDGYRDIKHYYNASKNCISAHELIEKKIYPKIVTIMYDINKYENGYSTWCKGSPVGDLPMCLQLYLHGNAAYIREPMSVYRLDAGNSWTSSINKSFKKRYKHRKALNNVWRQFDKVSNYRYTKIVTKGIRKRNVIFIANMIKFFLNKITFGSVMKIEPVIRRFFKL